MLLQKQTVQKKVKLSNDLTQVFHYLMIWDDFKALIRKINKTMRNIITFSSKQKCNCIWFMMSIAFCNVCYDPIISRKFLMANYNIYFKPYFNISCMHTKINSVLVPCGIPPHVFRHRLYYILSSTEIQLFIARISKWEEYSSQ